MDAMVDLTGGMAERYEMKKVRNEKLHDIIARAIKARNAFVCCSKEGTYEGGYSRSKGTGLIEGHAYSVTAALKVEVGGRSENLFRIRNPWGAGEEWTGAWRDSDPRWDKVDSDTRELLNFAKDEDGEFWMNERDFKDNFAEVTICTLKPDLDMDGDADDGMFAVDIHGGWKGHTAGGCRNDPRGYAKNPQFLITISSADDPTIHDRNPSTCQVIIDNEEPKRLSEDYLKRNPETHRSGTYVNFREVVGRFDLKPGNYVLIPTTYDRFQEGTFLIRITAAKSISIEEFPPAPEDAKYGYGRR